MNKLEFKTRTYYENVLNEILWLFEKADYHNDTPLEGLYLLGYHCQLFEFQQNKEKKKTLRRNKTMSKLQGKIDFTLFISVKNANQMETH